MITLPLLVLAGISLFAVLGFEVRPGELHIKRLLWHTRIDTRALQSAAADPTALNGSIRLFGIGGLFCFCGLFRNKRLGNYRAYATNFANAVILTFPNSRHVVVTPDDPGKFVEAIAPKRA